MQIGHIDHVATIGKFFFWNEIVQFFILYAIQWHFFLQIKW